MKTENYFALESALHYFGVAITEYPELNEQWRNTIDKRITSSIDELLDLLDHILDDEKTPEIKMRECDLLDI